MRVKVILRVLTYLIVLSACLWAVQAEAAASGSAISASDISKTVTNTVTSLTKILANIALVVGIAFILTSFFKFHQHKLNPTQVPISQGVALLLIGAALTIFVVMIPTAEKAAFGSKAKVSSLGGTDLTNLLGKQ